jgi:hypothetical protein
MKNVQGAVPQGTLKYGYGPEGTMKNPAEPTDAQKLATLVGTGLTVAEAWKKIFGGP